MKHRKENVANMDERTTLTHTIETMLNGFGERVREAREKMGLTQEEFADQLGISRASLALYESGKREPKVDVLARLVEVTKVAPDFYLGRSDAMAHNSHEVLELLSLTDESLIAIADANPYAINQLLSHPAFHALLEYISAFVSPVLSPERSPSVLESARVRAHIKLEEIINSTFPESGVKPEDVLSNRIPIITTVASNDDELEDLLSKTEEDRWLVDRRPGSVSRARVLKEGNYAETIRSLHEQIKADQSRINELEDRIKSYSVAMNRIMMEEKTGKKPVKQTEPKHNQMKESEKGDD